MCANEVTQMGPLESLGMGPVARESSDQRGLAGPPAGLREGGEGSYGLSSIKTSTARVSEFPG